jgi:1,4-dihydroxy-2-naphthoate octaprenyltransferase
LPLASAGIILGAMLAPKGAVSMLSFFLVWLTAVLFQITSNLANDFGDFQKGTDTDKRKGEARMVATGAISAEAMRRAVVVFSILSLLTAALCLLQLNLTKQDFLIFSVLAVCSVIAAITYTMGKKAYGYLGLGDVFVFLFFGLLSVGGTYYLFAKEWDWLILLPASAVGLLSSAVLNLNNLRDCEGDAQNNKRTLVVKLGFEKAKKYHAFLLLLPFVLVTEFVFAGNYNNANSWLFLVSLPVFAGRLKTVLRCKKPELLDAELKKQAIGTLLFCILLGLGNIL